MNFFVKAVWDEEAMVFYSDNDIIGLHIEAETFGEIMVDIAPELILANHVTNDDLLTKPLRELVPVIWGRSARRRVVRPPGGIFRSARSSGSRRTTRPRLGSYPGGISPSRDFDGMVERFRPISGHGGMMK